MEGLLLFFFDLHRLKVFGFENLAAVETFYIIHAVAASDYLGAVVITGGLHKTALY
jgi:hypothetical protein